MKTAIPISTSAGLPDHTPDIAVNDIDVGPIKFRIPDDAVTSPEARRAAGIAPRHRDIALPRAGERVTVLDVYAVAPGATAGTIRPAKCRLALDAARILVDFLYPTGEAGSGSAWVKLSQCSFPDRNEFAEDAL